MRSRTRRNSIRFMIGGALMLVLTAVLGAAVVAVWEAQEAPSEAFYLKQGVYREEALKTKEFVLVRNPSDVIADSVLLSKVDNQMRLNMAGREIQCLLRAGSYKRLGMDITGMYYIQYRAQNGADCTGYYSVTPDFWALVYTISLEG